LQHLFRCIQLDSTDTEVFPVAATPGEWAIPGAFVFLNDTDAELTGKRKQAFTNGFLGIESFGWSTLVEVASIDDLERHRVIEALARTFVDRYGAPDLDAALSVAREEVAYACESCEHPPGTLIVVRRELTDDGIVENLHRINPTAAGHEELKIWEWSPDD